VRFFVVFINHLLRSKNAAAQYNDFMLYFIRHGQSQANIDRVFAGIRFSAPLTEIGIQQAEEVGQRLVTERIRIDQIVASPLERALHTARIIAQVIDIDPDDVRVDDRLAEYDMGELSGRPVAGVTPSQKVLAPGAEDPKAFQERVNSAVNAASLLAGNTLIVSHAGVARMLEATKQDLAPERFYELKGYTNAQAFELDL
jgi:probable phosphoglycerate mutase